jgi:outer membrane receptor protein involved in Fe transport
MKFISLLSFILPFLTFGQLQGKVTIAEFPDAVFPITLKLSNGLVTSPDKTGQFFITTSLEKGTITWSHRSIETDSMVFNSNKEPLNIVVKLKINQLSGIVVSAGKRAQKIEEIPISMEILKPTLIDNKGITDLEQAVDQSPGVYAMDGQVSIRGGSGFAYGAGSRVLLVWNGLPLLSGDAGDSKWNAIPLEQAAQVEILKGASSVLYGSGALNGIISLTEKEPTKKGETSMKVMSGFYDNPQRSSLKWWKSNPQFQQIDAYYGKMYVKTGFTISANGFRNDGYRQGETEARARISGTFFYLPEKIKKLKVGLGYNFQAQKTGNFIIWQSDTFAYTPSGGADTSIAASTLTYNTGWRLSIDPYVKYTDRFSNKHALKTRIYAVDNTNLSNASQSTRSIVNMADYQFQKSWQEKGVLTTGISYIQSDVLSNLFGNHESKNGSFYAQYDRKIKKLDLTAGVRVEYFEMDGKQGDSDFKLGENTVSPVYPIFRIGAHYALTKLTHLRASFGQGVRYPSVAERFTFASVGALNVFPNPSLKRETGWAAEIGIKQLFPIGTWKAMVDVAAFINEYDNMMEFTFGNYLPVGATPSTDPNNPYYIMKWLGFRAENAEKARISGIEFSMNSQGKIKEVELVALIGYTYMDPISLNNDSIYRLSFSDENSQLLKYRFNHLAKADVEATWKKISFGFSMRYASYMSNIDAIFEDGVAGTQILPGLKKYRTENNKGALVFDARFGWKITSSIRLGFIANNLLNAEYVTRPGDVQAPRNFMVQLQVKF